MLFTPCEHCTDMVTEKKAETSKAFTKKYLDKEMILCDTCRLSVGTTKLCDKGILNESNERTGFCPADTSKEP